MYLVLKNMYGTHREAEKDGRFFPLVFNTMDTPLSIGNSQTISQPYIVALMTEALELNGKEKTLEIGTGSGYQAAISVQVSEIYPQAHLRHCRMPEWNTMLFSGKVGAQCIYIPL